MRILIVEDNLEFADNLAEILRGEGYDVQCAPSAEQALQFADRSDFDGVVTDIRLPAMSGLELIAELARLKPALPVVVISALCEPSLAERATRAGARSCLAKPIKIKTLLSVMRCFGSPGKVLADSR